MDPVRQQYEAYPYPERDPADEAKRLIAGSPSDPVEIDHYLFRGRRDWSQPFRALVAGGGTGDGLVMLAQRLADMGTPAEIVYIDMSEASRAVAEARIAARGLTSVTFVTGDLLSAPDHGPFDYIDCCGVLHHLPDPDAGFSALATALKPEGGIGLMVYAPHGRSGVYPLQRAFGTLLADREPRDKVALAKDALAALPGTNLLARNPLVGDHKSSDAGLYDLLIHSRDRPYTVTELAGALERAGLGIVSMLEPARYDPMRYLPESLAPQVAKLDPVARMQVAEDLVNNMKTHVAYAARNAQGRAASGASPEAVPHLAGVSGPALARSVAKSGKVTVTLDGLEMTSPVPREAAQAISGIDGKRSLGDIAQGVRRDWMAFAAAWAPVHRALTGFNILHYSKGARR